MVATNATWFAGDARAYMIRGASALAAISGIAYTVGMLREEWRMSNVNSGELTMAAFREMWAGLSASGKTAVLVV